MQFWRSGVKGRYLIIRIKNIVGETFEYENSDHQQAAQWSDELVYYVHPNFPRPFDEPVFVDSDAQRVYVGWTKIQRLLPPKVKSEPSNTDLCVICLDHAPTHAMIPCGHRCLCEICSSSSITQCPLCRAVVQSQLRIY